MSKLIEKGSLVDRQPNFIPTEICLGFGIDTTVPIRVAAYALPIIQMGETYMNAQIEAYIATQFVEKLNGFNGRNVAENMQLIQAYVDLLSQEVSSKNVEWLEERPISDQQIILLEKFGQILRSSQNERVLRFADQRNGDESLVYLASHVLYMWDDFSIDESLYIIDRPTLPTNLVMIGGPAEQISFEVRNLILETRNRSQTKWQSDQLFTKIGRRPPYIALDADNTFQQSSPIVISLEDIRNTSDPDVQRDLCYLVVSLTETMKFEDIKKIQKGALNPYQRDDIQQACQKLQSIINQLRS